MRHRGTFFRLVNSYALQGHFNEAYDVILDYSKYLGQRHPQVPMLRGLLKACLLEPSLHGSETLFLLFSALRGNFSLHETQN